MRIDRNHWESTGEKHLKLIWRLFIFWGWKKLPPKNINPNFLNQKVHSKSWKTDFWRLSGPIVWLQARNLEKLVLRLLKPLFSSSNLVFGEWFVQVFEFRNNLNEQSRISGFKEPCGRQNLEKSRFEKSRFAVFKGPRGRRKFWKIAFFGF